jgi:predicted NUDIX family NTP pyrophosphohydrolase
LVVAIFSAQELLRRHNIDYIATKSNKFTTSCPHCEGGYLNVKIENDRVAWYCHNCEEAGSSTTFALW